MWIINTNKEVLLIKKAYDFNLRYPGCWTNINGNVETDESIIDSVQKCLFDKIGVHFDHAIIKEIATDKRDPYNYIYKTFIAKVNIDNKEIKLNKKFAIDYKWANYDEIINMINNGEIEYSLISRIKKYIIPLIK